MTRAPSALAIWIAVVPMPEEPPCTRKVSPDLSPPRSTMLCQTVKKVSGIAAPSTIDKPRERQRVAFVGQAIFGVAAADHQRKDAVADFPALDVGAQRHDLAGDFQSRNIRCAGRRRIMSLPLHHVRPVDAGGGDLDQNLAARRAWGVGRSSGTSISGPPGALMAMAVMRAGLVIGLLRGRGRRALLGRAPADVTTGAAATRFSRPTFRRHAMAAIDDDDRPKKKLAHEIGQDLSLLSVEELAERVQAPARRDRPSGSRHGAKARQTQRRRPVFQAVGRLRLACAKIKHWPQSGNVSLSFLDHYCDVSIFMDIEWLLSTLFDASLLSPSSRRQRRLLFCLDSGQRRAASWSPSA